MGILKKIIKEHDGFEALLEIAGNVVDKRCDELYRHYCALFANASYLKNLEWVLRHYNASKKITLSALFYTQTQYIHDKNCKNLEFYALYYCLFNAYLSNIYLLPYLAFDKLNRISHSKLFKHIETYFIRSGFYNVDALELLNELRLAREAYSYNLPLGGSSFCRGQKLHIDEIYKRVKTILPVVLQASNLLSFLSHYAWNKKAGVVIDEYEKYQSVADEMFFSFIEHRDYLGKHCLIDNDDYFRQGYVLRNWNIPFPISWFITEKMCEDLECGWEETGGDEYDINAVGRYLANTIDAF